MADNPKVTQLTREGTPRFIEALAFSQDSFSTEAALTRELFAALRFSSLIHFDELRFKWQSILAGRPKYGAGLVSFESLLQLRQSPAAMKPTTSVNMNDWVEKEYQELLLTEII